MTWNHEKKYPFMNMVDFEISYIVQQHDRKHYFPFLKNIYFLLSTAQLSYRLHHKQGAGNGHAFSGAEPNGG